MRALASSAWSTAPEFSTFGISLSQKQWLGHKAVLDSDPGQWPGHYCGQWQHWQQCLSHKTGAVLSSAQALHASTSLLSTVPVLWPQWCGPMQAVLEHCSATAIKLKNAKNSNWSHKFLVKRAFTWYIVCLYLLTPGFSFDRNCSVQQLNEIIFSIGYLHLMCVVIDVVM